MLVLGARPSAQASRTLPVGTTLDGEPFEPGSRQGDRVDELGVAVARDDLGGDRLRSDPETVHHPAFEIGAERLMGTDRTGDCAGRSLGESALEALMVDAVGYDSD